METTAWRMTGTKTLSKLRREGKSLVLTLPAYVARDLGLKPGDLVAVAIIDDRVVVRKVEFTGVTRPLEAESA